MEEYKKKGGEGRVQGSEIKGRRKGKRGREMAGCVENLRRCVWWWGEMKTKFMWSTELRKPNLESLISLHVSPVQV